MGRVIDTANIIKGVIMDGKEIGYRKEYKMRRLIPDRKYISVAMPYEVIERQASIHNLSVQDFIERFVVVAEYNSFDGVRYTFKEVAVKEGEVK
jgi:hypothetical protein